MLDLEVFDASLASGLLLNLAHWKALVAELRAARAVIEACRSWLRDDEAAGSTAVIRAVTTALMAYDKVTREATDG